MDAATFLEARPGGAAAVAIQGAPYDGGISWRAGAADGPREVRRSSQSIESYSPRARRDLRDVDLADDGDLEIGSLTPAAALAAIAEATRERAARGAAVVTLGGDHSVSIGTSAGLRHVYPDLAHVVFDAHLDLREQYEGSELSHACGTRHMALAGPTCVLGVRSGSREEFADADELLTAWSHGVRVPERMRSQIAARPVFVSVDLDVLDPSILPGTGNPEPGGPGYRELLEGLLALSTYRVVGLDVVEVAPVLDPSGLSAIVAAELVRDGLLGLLAR